MSDLKSWRFSFLLNVSNFSRDVRCFLTTFVIHYIILFSSPLMALNSL